MPQTKSKQKKPEKAVNSSQAAAEVLTLAEAAAYLPVPRLK